MKRALLNRAAPNRSLRARLAAATLLPALLAGAGCAPLGTAGSPAILERVADGDYDIGIRYPSKRARYVMIVEDDEETLTLTNRPVVAGREAESGAGAAPAATQRNDRVLAPCADATGNWYRHTPAGYVCAGNPAGPAATPATGGRE